MTGNEVVPWKPGDPPLVVRRAEMMSVAAREMRLARDRALAAYELPRADADEVLIVIFHREFPSPVDRDVVKRYTYVANWRRETDLWYVSQDPFGPGRPIRALDSMEFIRFVRPIGPAVKLSGLGLTHPPVYASVWFLPTQAAR